MSRFGNLTDEEREAFAFISVWNADAHERTREAKWQAMEKRLNSVREKKAAKESLSLMDLDWS